MESQSVWQQGYMRVLLAICVGMVIVALGAYTHQTLKEARYWMHGPVTIDVAGEGEVNATPDIGTFSFGVRGEGETAEVAQSQSAEVMNAILAYLTEEGVAEADVETSNYSLNPQYRYEERVCAGNMYCPPGEQILDGYEVYQFVTVKVRETAEAGNLISGAGERGATNISGLSFTIDDETDLLNQAREAAIADARSKAEALADDLGVRIVKMTAFYEEYNSKSPMYGYGGDMMEDRAMESAAVAPQLPVGEDTVTSRVHIIYEVR